MTLGEGQQMNLKDAYCRAAVETKEQFDACLKSGKVQLIYIDSAYFEPEDYAGLVSRAHSAGVLCGLRLPFIWRKRAEEYFEGGGERLLNKSLNAACGRAPSALISEAGFDIFLFRNTESIFYFAERGLLSGKPFVTDHSIYSFNKLSADMLMEMLELPGTDAEGGMAAAFSAVTFPLELNEKELVRLGRSLKKARSESRDGPEADEAGTDPGCIPLAELVVYGRAPMMVSAQCINKTVGRCDGKAHELLLRDRTRADMPVKNCCRFCYNTIYNSVPTVLFDLEGLASKAGAGSIRSEFTVERAEEVRLVLEGIVPKDFTRGHLKRGV